MMSLFRASCQQPRIDLQPAQPEPATGKPLIRR